MDGCGLCQEILGAAMAREVAQAQARLLTWFLVVILAFPFIPTCGRIFTYFTPPLGNGFTKTRRMANTRWSLVTVSTFASCQIRKTWTYRNLSRHRKHPHFTGSWKRGPRA